jgi:hypothetical protein
LRLDEAAPRHPSDGGGRAWIDEGPSHVVAGTAGRWSIVYETGPLGIAEGGAVVFQVPAFWGWSPPQLRVPGRSGYSTVATEADGVELRAWIAAQNMVVVDVAGRALREGERVRFVYGAGESGARADDYAERRQRFWVTVDGNGDGVRRLVADSPAVDVGPGPATRLVVTVPSVAEAGESVSVTVAALDRVGNAAAGFTGVVEFPDLPAGLTLSPRVAIEDGDLGRASVPFRAERDGVYRIRASAAAGVHGESNPMSVGQAPWRIFWADLQVHSNISDGTGTPADLYRYAREVAGLDVAAVTDHDHWGTPFLDRSPEIWEQLREEARRFHEPGRFLTFLGYEWTSWLHGHRHVLYHGDEGEVLSSLDPPTDTPTGLWDGLRSARAFTIAHHQAGDPIATDWSVPPDPELEPVTEIVSVHGSSEASDSPSRVAGAIPGNYVRDALDRGYRLGFVGSGDGHDGHPGLAHLGARTGGLTAILALDLTREKVIEALRARRVYATSGPRILLWASLGGHDPGSVVRLPSGSGLPLHIHVIGTAPIERVDVVRSGEVVESIAGAGPVLEESRTLHGLRSGEYVYVRIVQRNGGLAWCSPFFVD